MTGEPPKDLVVLLVDVDAENAVRGILTRHQALAIRPLPMENVDIHRHLQRDPGCYGSAEAFLRPFIKTHRFALVLFDRRGSGAERLSALEIERDVEKRLCNTGWNRDRCAVVVPDPELEVWVWSDSPNVDRILGWADRPPRLRDWLVEKSLVKDSASKPDDPKRAMRDSLRERRVPLSARLFRDLATRVSLDRCQDRAFVKLRDVLRKWFEP